MQQYTKSNKVMESENHFKNGTSPKSKISKRHFKLFTLFAFILLFGFKAVAQDVIVLKNGDEIKSLVQEVGTDYVKYKKFDNQTGPVYNIATSEIFMIKYNNGSRDVFGDNTTSDVPPAATPQNVQKQSEQNSQKEKEKMSGSLPLSAFAGIPLSGSVGSLTFDGTDRTIYGKNTYLDFLKENCPEAYDFYKSQRTAYRWSYACMLIGAACTGFFGAMYHDEPDNSYALYTAVSGGALAVGGIIGLISTMNYDNKSIALYNKKCTQKQKSDYSLNFGITRSGGLGFTLNF